MATGSIKTNRHKGVDAVNYITNIMLIDLANPDSSLNDDGVIATEDATTILNSPVTSGAFYAYRTIKHIKSVGIGYKVVITLDEAYPVPGRRWQQAYNPDVSSWGNGWVVVGSKDMFYIDSVQVTIPENVSSTAITAPTIAGYEFVCWLQSASTGSIRATYISDIRNATDQVWRPAIRTASADTRPETNVLCFALYVRRPSF